MEDKYEYIKFIIQRFDHYYNTVNSKGAFYIGLNTFIFSGTCVGYTSLYKIINANTWIWILLVVLIVSCLLSIFFTIGALRPYRTDNHANNPSPSLMYFGGISRYEFSYLKEKMQEKTMKELSEDALEQMHSLARGLTKKFKKFNVASTLLQIQFFTLIPLFFLIIKNLK